MCGRFALGLAADEILNDVNAHYFQQDPVDDGEENGRGDGGEEEEDREGTRESSGDLCRIMWSDTA
jgi:hypothetical protein